MAASSGAPGKPAGPRCHPVESPRAPHECPGTLCGAFAPGAPPAILACVPPKHSPLPCSRAPFLFSRLKSEHVLWGPPSPHTLKRTWSLPPVCAACRPLPALDRHPVAFAAGTPRTTDASTWGWCCGFYPDVPCKPPALRQGCGRCLRPTWP